MGCLHACLHNVALAQRLHGGGFGAVELYEHKKTQETYAMKGLSKGYIVKTGLQESHVVLNKEPLHVGCEPPEKIVAVSESTTSIATDPLWQQRRELVEAAFHACDADRGGYLIAREMHGVAIHTGFDGTVPEWIEEFE